MIDRILESLLQNSNPDYRINLKQLFKGDEFGKLFGRPSVNAVVDDPDEFLTGLKSKENISVYDFVYRD